MIKEQLGQERVFLENQLLLNQNVIDAKEKGKSDCEIDCSRELIDVPCFDLSSCLADCRRDFDPLIKSAQDYADRLNKRLRKLATREALL